MAFPPLHDVRLEIDCRRIAPECCLELMSADGSSLSKDDREAALAFFANIDGVLTISSMPDVLSFDINDHMRHHLRYLSTHDQSVRDAAANGALRLVLPRDTGQWLRDLDPGLVVVVESYVCIETDRRAP
jgi:hypothetical protein